VEQLENSESLPWRELAGQRGSIDAYKGGMKEGWLWMLPSKSAKKDEERQEKNVAFFGNLGALRQDFVSIRSDEEAISGLTSQQYDKKVDVV
jgi:hypothetical protein